MAQVNNTEEIYATEYRYPLGHSRISLRNNVNMHDFTCSIEHAGIFESEKKCKSWSMSYPGNNSRVCLPALPSELILYVYMFFSFDVYHFLRHDHRHSECI